jgi:hypothetical protein
MLNPTVTMHYLEDLQCIVALGKFKLGLNGGIGWIEDDPKKLGRIFTFSESPKEMSIVGQDTLGNGPGGCLPENCWKIPKQ